jgi:subtilisin family serine protease
MLAASTAQPSSQSPVPRVLITAAALAAILAVAVGERDQVVRSGGSPVEVVIRLASPPLAYAQGDRARAERRIVAEQAALSSAVRGAVPDAVVRWRYRIVANGIAVVVPEGAVPRLRSLPGVRDVLRGTSYTAALDRSPGRIGAPALWGPQLATAGQGVKIGIIDDGIDQTHPFFSPAGYTMPAGFPKGQLRFTTAKVVVARAFPPPGATWKNASMPFDPLHSAHGTHVAGIAAGNSGTRAQGGRTVSGVAPRAYLGNYKALTIPTDAGVGLDGNAPELVAAIEAAVADGMDVINLSIGEPEIQPSRDVVALALDAAAAAGVVPVVAAGNDFSDYGVGTVSSPGTSKDAITVAAVTVGAPAAIGSFSAAGPTALSLRAKPDVAAPGVGILSSVPGGWTLLAGTSMASPHVAGGAALLRQRHPGWSPAVIKSALVGTARQVPAQPPTRVGSGLVQLAAADEPLVIATPSSISLGLVDPSATASSTVQLADVGGGQGAWDVDVVPATAPPGTTVAATAARVTVPGTLELTAIAGTAAGETSGVVRLSRGGVVRRIPYWFRVADHALAQATATPLPRPGVYRGDTRGRAALVDRYRYPEVPPGGPVTAVLRGPEQVFRLQLSRPVANFGVVITSRGAGSAVEPRVVEDGDENRLTGYAALPVNGNPYLSHFGASTPVAGALRPGPGSYDVVFDSATTAGAGAFSFRFWVDDTRPPTTKLVARTVRKGTVLRVRVDDAGSGVDPASVAVRVDGRTRPRSVRAGVVRIPTAPLSRGRHTLRVQVSDYQETRNTENVARILPNTRVLTTTVTVR